MCKMFFIGICALLLGTIDVSAITETLVLGAEWEEYKMVHKKYYGSFLEEQNRFEVFKQNKFMIAKHNRLYAKGIVTYEQGLNAFSDMTLEEIFRSYTMTNATNSDDSAILEEFSIFDDFVLPEAPDNIDWRSKGAITPIRNQGQCGSCWAFAAMGALEAHHFIKHKKLVSLSVQNIVDCSKKNNGCNGGWPYKALEYVHNNRGVDTEQSYPYLARNGRCHFNKKTVGAIVSKVFRLHRNEQALKKIVGTIGPVTVGITVAKSFFHYRGGVYNEPKCRTLSRHAILVVGYGTDQHGGPYWLVKNSWGEHWGEKGYIRMARNKNVCGIVNNCAFPQV